MIIEQSKNIKTFESLVHGDVFEDRGHYYIKNR